MAASSALGVWESRVDPFGQGNLVSRAILARKTRHHKERRMRAAVRLSFFVVLASSLTVTANARILEPIDLNPLLQTELDGGVNNLVFSKGSPAPTTGGVNVSAQAQPTTGYVCTKITVRVIDNATGMTLDTYIVNNPVRIVTKSFTGLGSNKEIQVTVDAVFQNVDIFDAKHIEAVVTTL
jgi:hypothetical protein